MSSIGFKQVELGLYHLGCFCSRSTEKYPEIKLTQISPAAILKSEKDTVTYNILWDVLAPSRTHLSEYLEGIKKFEELHRFEVLTKRNLNATLLTKIKGPNSSQEEIIRQGGLYSSPVKVQNGFEQHSIISTNAKDLKKILLELDQIGEVKQIKIRNIEQSNAKSLLTPKQFGVLKTALKNNYYSWPRNVTLEEMANELNISRRAFQERLRKAESKLFPSLIKEYFLTKEQ